MTAVAGFVLDEDPIPPPLQQALNYKAWGVGDIMALPAGLLPQMNVALNYYYPLIKYHRNQGPLTAWIEKNPADWEVVTRVLKERNKGK